MLSIFNRFHGHGSLRYVYKNGSTTRSHLITVKYVKNTRRDNSRFAVVVSKKVHKSAAGRNRIRRRIYEIVRRELPYLKNSHDIIILVFSGEVLNLPPPDLNKIINQIFSQSDLYK